MTYVWSGVEQIPFPNNYFDVIASFNSLDHVDDLDMAISQIKLKLKPSGLFLLLTDVNHDPTPTEPITYSWDIKNKFQPEFKLIEERHYEKHTGMYESIHKGQLYDHKNPQRRYGILSAMFMKL
ncbi:MAG: class I SAM-dependent methyltransferase [Acidobacteriota bacterium]|jgi:ubiquinone/menaquinone biosynthesis C-methylase UbiE|nr:class I SAM-dependent methyltransferase [Acidobacteriota bacterium]